MKRAILLQALWFAIACGDGGKDDSGPASRRDTGVSADAGTPDTGVIDPCSRCSPNALCLGGSCSCNAGYSGNGFSCTDVDECASGAEVCTAHSTCSNTAGAYDCFCDGGYEPSGNECAIIACSACAADKTCGGGAQCLQRYCDGRFGCYAADACGTIDTAACSASSAYEPCATQADCPAPYSSGGASVTFYCRPEGSPTGALRCWPYFNNVIGGEAQPTMPMDCPPAPPDSEGVVVRKVSSGEAPWDGLSYCKLGCEATSVCPAGMACISELCR